MQSGGKRREARRHCRPTTPTHPDADINKPPNEQQQQHLLDHLFLQHLIMCYRCFHFAFITLPRMLLNAVRLILFVICLLPGFIQFAYYYWFVANRVSVKYANTSKRQTLDVYKCSDSSEINLDVPGRGRRPVVVFCPGGAWLIGYKMWGALTARALTASGIVVIVPDYRNYPWTTVPGMVEDVSFALQWTLDHVHEYGGDPHQVVVVGQSAGGHLAFTALLRRALGIWDCSSNDAGVSNNIILASTSTRYSSDGEAILEPRITSGDGRGVVVDGGAVPASPSSQSSASSASSSVSSFSGQHPPRLADEEEFDDDEADHREADEASATRALMNASDAMDGNSLNRQLPQLSVTWEATDFKGLITLSAPFDLAAMSKSFQRHGLDKHIVDRIFGADVNSYDPRSLLESAALDAPLRLPPVRVFHGDADQTVPTCEDFCDVLLQRLVLDNNSAFSYTTYPHWSHTDAIIEGPMMANHTFHRDVFDAVREWTGPPYDVVASSPATAAPAAPVPSYAMSSPTRTSTAAAPTLEWPDDNHPALRPLCPKCLVHLGRFFMPF